jgi:hypothetical protein
MYLSYTPIVRLWGFVCYKTLIVIVQPTVQVTELNYSDTRVLNDYNKCFITDEYTRCNEE